MFRTAIPRCSSRTARFRHAAFNFAVRNAFIVCFFFPFFGAWHFLTRFFGANLTRSWDGRGHLAASYIYDRTTFPDTFGWTSAWFGGMPLPNYYPPLFYWLIGLLHHIGLPFLLAFKLLAAVPLLLIPASLALLSWYLTPRSSLAAC